MSVIIERDSFPRGGLLATGAKESYEVFAWKNSISVSQGGAALARAVWDDFKAAGFKVEEDIKYLSDNQGTRYFVKAGTNNRHFDLGQSATEYEAVISGWTLKLECQYFDITHTFTPQHEGL